MEEDNRSFLGRFGSFLLDGLEATAALQLQREFLPADDRVFTQSPIGPQPVGWKRESMRSYRKFSTTIPTSHASCALSGRCM